MNLINGTIFETRVTEHKRRFDFLYNFETFLILRRIQRDIVTNYIDLQVKDPSMLADFNDYIKKKTLKYQISLKSMEWKRSCSIWTDRLLFSYIK